MKKISKKKLIISFSILLIIIIIINIFIVINNKQKDNKNIEIIKSSYQSLVDEVSNYNDIRSKYIDLTNNFYLDTFKDHYEEYNDLLTKYNEVINYIDTSINKLDNSCYKLYKDKDINKICRNYKSTYEKLINLYVSDISKYNKFIDEYNAYKNDSVLPFEMLHQEYIDYNNDQIFEGKDNNEESKKEK